MARSMSTPSIRTPARRMPARRTFARRTSALRTPAPRPLVIPAALAAGLALLLLLPAAAGEIVRLRDGTLVHGEITDFDEGTGFTLVRADTGGRVPLRWEHLPPAEVTRLKESRGFTGEDPQPWLVDVVHLLMKNGTTESGVLVDDGRGDVYTLRRRHGTDSFPKQYVRTVETGRVDGLSVYPPEELYGVMLAELGTPVTAAQHFALAVACEGAGLYQPALDHYASVQALDPKLKSELIATRLPRLAIKLEDKAETAFLDDIRNRLYRKQFDDALGMVNAFRAQYPASRQLGELSALEGDIGRQRKEFYAAKVVSDYFSFLGKALNEIARRDGMTLGAAVQLLEESVHDDIVKRIATTYRTSDEQAAALWTARRGGSVRTSSYGTGTFVLGEQKALDFFDSADDPGKKAAPEEAKPEEEESLEKRIEDVLAQRAQQAQARAKQKTAQRDLSAGLSPDDWWASVSLDDKVAWLSSYYAEFSGQIKVLRAKPRPCRTCDALGTVDQMNEEKGQIEAVTCPTCKGLKSERLVNYR
jgi:hypothetical protein